MITIQTYKKLTNTNEVKKAERNLVKWCHLFIRLRDLAVMPGGSVAGHCISCGKLYRAELFSDRSVMNGREWHAGHYFKSDKFESVRYDERNINGQCNVCNRHRHGNEALYEINLIKKIGAAEFENLKIAKNKPHKFNIIEIEEMTENFKIKAKQEAKRLNIKI